MTSEPLKSALAEGRYAEGIEDKMATIDKLPMLAKVMDRIVIRGGAPLNGVIPISGAKNAALPLLAAASLPAVPNPGALSQRHVLVVDDNATNRRILALQAAKWGMVVRDTENPLEAVQLALAEPFDLAVIDMHMPHMDGVTLARRLRDLKPELPRVLFTSLGRREVVEELFAALMMKPLRQSQLFETLLRLGDDSLIFGHMFVVLIRASLKSPSRPQWPDEY